MRPSLTARRLPKWCWMLFAKHPRSMTSKALGTGYQQIEYIQAGSACAATASPPKDLQRIYRLRVAAPGLKKKRSSYHSNPPGKTAWRGISSWGLMSAMVQSCGGCTSARDIEMSSMQLLPAAANGDCRGVRGKSALLWLRPMRLGRSSPMSPGVPRFASDRSIGGGRSCAAGPVELWARRQPRPSAGANPDCRATTHRARFLPRW
jgi:hypothetical protein